MKPLYKVIADALQARQNCIDKGNTKWCERWELMLKRIDKQALPSGSGIDNGCSIDLDRSTGERIVIRMDFHHMNKDGYYNGWTEYTVIVRPSLASDFSLHISGRDRNYVKEYLHDIFDACLRSEVNEYPCEDGIN